MILTRMKIGARRRERRLAFRFVKPTSWQLVATVLGATALIVGGAGALAPQLGTTRETQPPSPKSKTTAPKDDPTAPVEKQPAPVDVFGDPLPPGAIARLGTVYRGIIAHGHQSSAIGGILIWDVARRHESRPARLSAPALKSLWHDLSADDARRADQAIHILAARPQQSIPFLKENLRPVEAIDLQLLARLIGDLESDQFTIRQKAGQELERLDELAGSALRKSLSESRSPETRRRIEQLLTKQRLATISGERLRAVRAVEVLEAIGTVEAKDILQALAKGGA
jgi:hypothetical protein